MNNSSESESGVYSRGDGRDDARRIILLVDPSPAAEQHAAEFERECDHVITAVTVEDALARLSTTAIDCVVSTLQMPDEDTIELVKHVRAEYPSIPVTLCPDSGDDHIASDAITATVTEDSHPRDERLREYDSIGNRFQDATTTHSESTARDVINDTIKLLSAICSDLSHATTRSEAIQRTVQCVCESTDWDYCEIWQPRDNGESLRLEGAWPGDEQFASFVTMSESITFQPDEGLPGRVWATASEEWITDISAVPAQEYIRSAGVEETPLKSAVGVPVTNGESANAVLVFYSANELPNDSPLRTIVNAVQRILNEFLSEHHASTGGETGSTLPFSFMSREDADQSQESPLHLLADHVNITMWMATPDFEEIVYTNSNFERIAGIPPSEFLEDPRSLLDIVHPDDREDVQHVWESRSDAYTIEYRVQTAEGETRWIKEQGTPVEQGNELQYFVGTAEDITECKQQEEELKRQHEVLHHTEKLARTGGWIADLDTGTQQWTKGTKAIHDVPSDFEPTIEAGIEFFHPDDRETIERVFNRCAETGEPYDVELRIITAEDRQRWVRATGEAVREGVEITKVCGAIQDITDRKNREQGFERARSQMELALEVTDAVVWEWDFESDTVTTYPDTHHLLETDVETVDDFLDGIHPDDRDTVRDALDTAIETTSAYDVEFRVHHDDTVRWVDDHGEIHCDSESTTKKLIGVARDITNRKEREQELRREREHLQQTERLAQSGGWMYDCETESLRITDGFRHLIGLQTDHGLSLEESFDFYHPDDRETLMQAFERCRRTGDPYEIEVRIITSNGHERWIHEYGERITKNGDQKVQGASRDITDRKLYENALEGVNTAARDLLSDETDAEIAHTIVDTATSVLDVTGVAVYLYDEQVEKLVPTAASEKIVQFLDGLPRFAPGDSIAWDVFVSQEPAGFADVRTADNVYRADTMIRSEYVQPLGEYGVLIVGDTDIDAFSDLTRDIITILASTAEAAFDRAERTQTLNKREQASQRQAQRLERVEHLNEHIRSIIKAIVQAGSRETIKQIVCDSFAAQNHFEGVWVGEPNLATHEVDNIASNGSMEQYLESVSRDLDPENTLPAVQAIQKRTTVVEGNLAARPHQDDWRHPALLCEFRSVISLPLIYKDILYGVLTIYSNQPEVFDDPTISVLTELGELIGYVLNSITHRHARLADEMVELRFVLSEADDVIIELSSQLDTSIHIASISTRNEDRFLVHLTIPDADPDDVIAVAESLPTIENVELIADGSSPRFEMITTGECVGTQIERLGAHLKVVTIEDGSCDLQVQIPHDRDVETFVHQLKNRYPKAELTSQQNQTRRTATSCRWLLDEHLTERQKDTLTAAYHSGYFDQTRKRKGGEIAESLGISQPGFAKQLRAAEYNLLAALLE